MQSYHMGIYLRESVSKLQSDSIAHQLLVVRNWIGEQEMVQETACYRDEGYSGTHFNRPAFQQMLRDAECGRINGIVCKDLSRLGRNYLELGEYIEKIFPSLGVRVVCINESYDSAMQMPGSLEYNVRNVMNEWYARDIGRKVHLAKEQSRRNGGYVGGRPPYGWEIDYDRGIRNLRRDPSSADVVEQMIQLRQSGKTLRQVKCWLQESEIQTPQYYRLTGQIRGEHMFWEESSIRNVIKAYQRYLSSYTSGDNHPA